MDSSIQNAMDFLRQRINYKLITVKIFFKRFVTSQNIPRLQTSHSLCELESRDLHNLCSFWCKPYLGPAFLLFDSSRWYASHLLQRQVERIYLSSEMTGQSFDLQFQRLRSSLPKMWNPHDLPITQTDCSSNFDPCFLNDVQSLLVVRNVSQPP